MAGNFIHKIKNWFQAINWLQFFTKVREHWLWVIGPIVIGGSYQVGRYSYFFSMDREIQTLKQQLIEKETELGSAKRLNEKQQIDCDRENFRLEQTITKYDAEVQKLKDTIDEIRKR